MIRRVRKFIRALVLRIKQSRRPSIKTCLECGAVHLCGAAA